MRIERKQEAMVDGRCSWKTYILAFAALTYGGCSKDGMKTGESPSTGSGVETYVEIEAPMHLTSNLSSDVEVRVFVVASVSKSRSVEAVKNAASLTGIGNKSSVAGVWTISDDKSAKFYMYYRPAQPLADGDYIFTLTGGPQVEVGTRNTTAFRVGSMPRVRKLYFGATNKVLGATISTNIDRVKVGFSEPVDTGKANAEFLQQGGSGWKSLAATNDGTGEFLLGQVIDFKALLKIRVMNATSAVSGKALDGAYSGVAGSGAFEAEFIPEAEVEKAGLTWTPNPFALQ